MAASFLAEIGPCFACPPATGGGYFGDSRARTIEETGDLELIFQVGAGVVVEHPLFPTRIALLKRELWRMVDEEEEEEQPLLRTLQGPTSRPSIPRLGLGMFTIGECATRRTLKIDDLGK